MCLAHIRDEHGSELDRTEKIICVLNVIILNVPKILVVIRFYRFAKWQCNFAINDKNLC